MLTKIACLVFMVHTRTCTVYKAIIKCLVTLIYKVSVSVFIKQSVLRQVSSNKTNTDCTRCIAFCSHCVRWSHLSQSCDRVARLIETFVTRYETLMAFHHIKLHQALTCFHILFINEWLKFLNVFKNNKYITFVQIMYVLQGTPREWIVNWKVLAGTYVQTTALTQIYIFIEMISPYIYRSSIQTRRIFTNRGKNVVQWMLEEFSYTIVNLKWCNDY